MDDSRFNWTLIYAVLLALATLVTLATLLLSFKQILVNESAVQYITYSVVRSCFIYSFSRFLFYLCVIVNYSGVRDVLDDVENGQLVGVRVIYSDETSSGKSMVVLLALIGDVALLCMTFWVILLAYEMARLIAKSMDRGRAMESHIVHVYCVRTYGIAFLFAALMIVSALLSPQQERTVRDIALTFQLVCVWVSFLYPLGCTLFLSLKKRTKKVVPPTSRFLHRRIRNLVIVYCVLVFPSCLVELLNRVIDVPIIWVGLSQALYYLSGGASALVIGTSVTCCYRTLRPVMPPSVYEQLLEKGYFPEELEHDRIVEPPMYRPIFVNTDIEGSTSLWATNTQAMSDALSLHDDLMRKELLRCNGYEITTAGDAFQLAFHTVSDAIRYCMHVQSKLLKVDWPPSILKTPHAARCYDIWGHLLFNGLRVRMAIHDGDEQLICSKHPTTGKMTYLGMSETVARELGDMGKGGQILISESALAIYEDERAILSEDKVHGAFSKQPFDLFERMDLGISFQLYELISTKIGDRFRRDRQPRNELASSRLMLLHPK
uniref:Guanylate cyclase domain-containing protein n=1 Tax=Globisporangium ultimum (strain ATCC 200006 / CBS 805.95 / DAOM BR144) TaxID=431595 RepID=K3XA21_GLOUD